MVGFGIYSSGLSKTEKLGGSGIILEIQVCILTMVSYQGQQYCEGIKKSVIVLLFVSGVFLPVLFHP